MHTNPEMLRARREQLGLTQNDLAAATGLSLRSIKGWEQSGGASIRSHSARKLALVLGVDVARLLADFENCPADTELPRFLLQQIFPNLDPEAMEQIREGAIRDMLGDHEGARVRLEEALQQAASSDDLENQALIMVRYATSLDNAGRSTEARVYLDRLVTNPRWKTISPVIRLWCKYHIALALRRLGEAAQADAEAYWKPAEEAFHEVRRKGDADLQTAATHQLGCLYLARARWYPKETVRKRHIRAAQQHLEQAEHHWRKAGNFREGYSLRRLAEIAEILGDRQRAHELLLDALEIFVKHGAQRYRNEVRERLQRFVTQPQPQNTI